uniref:Uncharacterized protein n=1 Tax=viral metagenome TaxID=1070528 RepID=A0A6C0BPQ6_9ZZZZ
MELTLLVMGMVAYELYFDVNCHFYDDPIKLTVPLLVIFACEYLGITSICVVLWFIYIFLTLLYVLIWIHKKSR